MVMKGSATFTGNNDKKSGASYKYTTAKNAMHRTGVRGPSRA